jgi:hypothetical protein
LKTIFFEPRSSWVARIKVMSHWCLASPYYFSHVAETLKHFANISHCPYPFNLHSTWVFSESHWVRFQKYYLENLSLNAWLTSPSTMLIQMNSGAILLGAINRQQIWHPELSMAKMAISYCHKPWITGP